jgi:hypothetical protein
MQLPRDDEKIRPVGKGPHFSYNPSNVRIEDLSPRSSTPSADLSSSRPRRSLSPDPYDSDRDLPKRPESPFQMVYYNSFTILEMGESDIEQDSEDDDVSVMHPDTYEDAASASEAGSIVRPHTPRKSAFINDLDARMLAHDLEALECSDNERELWKRKRRMQRRRNRLSSGSIHKRTLSQSIGSSTDEEDLQPQHVDVSEAGSSARRLRRKMAGERTSLIFDEQPQRIIEEHEPESEVDVEAINMVVPDVDIDVEEVLRRALPYYSDSEADSDSSMDIDSDDE